MDNQSLLDDIEKRSIESSSTQIQMRNIPYKNPVKEFRISSEKESYVESDNERVNIKRGLNRLSTRSMQDPGILMTLNQKSHKLNERYKFHVFIIYHPADRNLANGLVKRLESSPHEYKCCIDTRDFVNGQSQIQNIVCSLMLSERVIILFCKQFFVKLWPSIEELLFNVTTPTFQMNSKLIGIYVEKVGVDYNLPECLKNMTILNFFDQQFWQLLLMNLRRDTSSVYNSSSTLWSLVSQTTPLFNGQVIYLINVQIHGLFKPRYCIQIESSPNAGPLQESAINELISEDMFENVLDSLHLTDSSLTYFDSAWPNLLIFAALVIWLIGFTVVIRKLPDSKDYTLPIRLCVFILPALLIIVSILYRFKSVDSRKVKRTKTLFSRTTSLNAQFFKMNKNILSTSVRSQKQNIHIIYLIHYSLSQCSETIRHILKTLKETETTKLNIFLLFVQKQEKMDESFRTYSNNDQLCLLLANSYLSCLLSHNLIPCLHQRHIRKYQCLCQFSEDFLSAYLPFIRYPMKFNAKHIESVLRRFFFSTLSITPKVYEELGLNIVSSSGAC